MSRINKMLKSEKIKWCQGCNDDFYNGNNPYGIKECWNLKSAIPVWRKKIHINQPPPWKQDPIKVFNCYKQKGYVFWNPSKEC